MLTPVVDPQFNGIWESPGKNRCDLAATGIGNVNFTVTPDPHAAPTINSPSQGQVIPVSAVSFSWGSIAGAAGYDLAIHNRAPAVPCFPASSADRHPRQP